MLTDIQNLPDGRGVAIDHVGVNDLRHPIVVLDRAKERMVSPSHGLGQNA